MTRQDALERFLQHSGHGGAPRGKLAQDGSFRSYSRLQTPQGTLVLMDAPPPEDVAAFVRVGNWIATTGLSVPRVIAEDRQHGFLLLEDFGDDVFTHADMPAETLFDLAVDVLLVLQAHAPPADLPAWDAGTMIPATLGTLLDWWWPACFAAPAPEAARRDFTQALAEMLAPLAADPPVFVHRDYFAANLMWLPERDGARRAGILDYQTAGRGHYAYDLVSLTQNARADTPPALAVRAVGRYLAARPEIGAERLAATIAICSAQRHLRVAAQWVRLALRDGKPHYLAHGPRTWALLEAALAHPACRPLAEALDRWIPPARRGNPAGVAA